MLVETLVNIVDLGHCEILINHLDIEFATIHGIKMNMFEISMFMVLGSGIIIILFAYIMEKLWLISAK